MVVVPLFTVGVAKLYHTVYKLPNVDPAYGSIFRVVFEIADFLSDIIFTISLISADNIKLYPYAIAFVALPFMLSLSVLSWIALFWRRHNPRINNYLERHDSLFYTLSLFSSVFSTIRIATSKLFYLDSLNLQLKRSEFFALETMRFFCVVICEV